MTHSWQLQEAKSKFSKLVELARKEGPQVVTKHGKDAVVVVSAEEYKGLIKRKMKFSRFLRESPLAEIELDLKRDKSTGRDVEL